LKDFLEKFFLNSFIVVSPEYNATICPTLTNLMNYFPPAIYRHKPASIVTYSMGK
jgi:NAD(P)H-dependent FMN reductase